jgi:endonuclease/exonuclease/phosphatase (EEP) superfamily protein YafD
MVVDANPSPRRAGGRLGRVRILTWLSLLACSGIVAILAAGFFGSVHPALDSLAHFRAHLAIVLIVAALPLFWTELLKAGALLIAVGLLCVATTSGGVPVPRIGVAYGALLAKPADRPVYTLLQANLRYDNPDMNALLSAVGRLRPDVMTLDEVSVAWREKLTLLKAAYPYQLFCPFPNGLWGSGIVSRRPFAPDTTPGCDPRGGLALARIDFGGTQIDVAALHLGWPWPFPQARELSYLAPYLARIGSTAILAGDLNATPWSHTAARVAGEGGLTLMPSTGPTWLHYGLPRWLLFCGLPIDNVFAKGNVEVHSIAHGEDIASDHIPLVVAFSIRPDHDHDDEPRPTATAALSGSLNVVR